MEGRQERVELLDRAHDLSSLSGEVEAVARGDRSMQQCRCRSSSITSTAIRYAMRISIPAASTLAQLSRSMFILFRIKCRASDCADELAASPGSSMSAVDYRQAGPHGGCYASE